MKMKKKESKQITELYNKIYKLEERIERLNGRIDGLNYLIKQIIKN